MTKVTKIRARRSGALTEILVLVNHPMETGWREDKVNHSPVPAHYIEQMTFELNGSVVAQAHLGAGIAANPLTGIALHDARPGDEVVVRWVDNTGEGDTARTTLA